jgi:PAS domain S-box-containing protein
MNALDERWLAKAILENPHVGVVVTGVDGVIRFFNKGLENLSGYKAEEVVGKVRGIALMDPADVEKHAEELRKLYGVPVGPGREGVISGPMLTGEPEEHVWTFVRKDGSRYKGLMSLRILRDDKGEMQGFLAVSIPLPKEIAEKVS